MRLLIQSCTLLLGIFVLLMVALFNRQDIDHATLNLYLVSIGHGFNKVYFADNTGLFELPFRAPPGVPTPTQQHPFSTMMAEMLVRNNNNGSVSRIRFAMNNTPRYVRHLGELPVDQKPPKLPNSLDSFPQHQSTLTYIGAFWCGCGILLIGLRQLFVQRLQHANEVETSLSL